MDTWAAIIRQLDTLPARFHLDLEPAPDTHTIAEVISNPALLRSLIDVDAKRVGANDEQVAASMFVQRTAMILGGATMASVLVAGVLPLADSDSVYIGLADPRPMSSWRFALTNPTLQVGESNELMEAWASHWIDGVLSELSDGVRSLIRVGGRLLRDNLASAAASTLVFFSHWEPTAGYTDLAPRLVGLGRPPFGQAVSFQPIEHEGREGLRSLRRSCCLHEKTDPPHSCPSCPRIDDQARIDIMRHHLGHLEAVKSGQVFSGKKPSNQ